MVDGGNGGVISPIDGNPYASPKGMDDESSVAKSPAQRIDYLRVLQSTWQVFRQNSGKAALFGSVQLLIQGLLYGIHATFDGDDVGFIVSIFALILADFYLLWEASPSPPGWCARGNGMAAPASQSFEFPELAGSHGEPIAGSR